MQTAPQKAATTDAPKSPNVVEQPPTRKRAIKPATWAVIGVIGLIALGTMLANVPLFGLWPPRSVTADIPVVFVPPTPYASGLLVEKAGDPRKEGDQVIVSVKVTNQVHVPVAVVGTVAANSPTPEPVPANVLNGIVRVLFYDAGGKPVGSGLGNVINLPYGQSAKIDVVATGVGDYTRFDIVADRVMTDKDPVKPTTAPAP